MQSGSFVNLSRLRKEQAAARALQEQQQQQAATLARAQQESLASLPPPPPSATPHEYGSSSGGQAYQGQYAPYMSTSVGSSGGNGGGGSSSTPSSSNGHSPLASPPPAVTSPGGPTSYLGSTHDSPSLLSPQDVSFPSAASSNGSGRGNGNAGFSLVRRHHTVGSRPQKYLSATQRDRLDEEDAEVGLRAEGDDFDDSGSTGAVEGSFDGHGAVGQGESKAAGLARAGSLPSKPSASYIQSSGSISRSQGVKRRPSLGAARLDTIPASGSLYAGSPSPDPKSPPADGSYEDDVEWERALAQSRKGGHHSDVGHDPRYAPTGNRLQSHRSLQFAPGSYHHPSQASYGYSSASPTSPPLSSTAMHQRSGSNISDSHLYVPASADPGVRRVQSLTQGPVSARLSDRLAVVAPGSSRSEDMQHGSSLPNNSSLSRQNSANRLRAGELPPPSSPTKASPWTSSVSPVPPSVGPSRPWSGSGVDGEAFGGPLSPVPQMGDSRWRAGLGNLDEPLGGNGVGEHHDTQYGPPGGMPMTQEEMQNAFDAMSLGRTVGASSSFSPPTLGVPGVTPHDLHAPMPHPPAVPSQSRGSSRGPSRNHSRSPSAAPPRFTSPSHRAPEHGADPAAHQYPGLPYGVHSQQGFAQSSYDQSAAAASLLKLSLLTDPSSLGEAPQRPAGPASASPYVPPIGHTSMPPQTSQPGGPLYAGGPPPRELAAYEKALTASGAGWDQKHAVMGGPAYGAQFGQGQQPFNPLLAAQAQAILAAQAVAADVGGGGGYPGAQYTQSLGSATGFLQSTGLLQSGAVPDPALINQLAALRTGSAGLAAPAPSLPSQHDMNALIQAKGYNPTTFDTSPAKARFFVIKSFTEDDVAKSLKFEIWSSTTFGNKRLDLAFKESAADMPIYLYFSVNSSGRFAGMAQMLTDVDYNTTSTVWAQDKWKGVFRLKWIFVKDIPNGALRHIRLTNTPEQKPVTNSRDTQELPFEGGVEMLKIFHAYQPRTTLLQDMSFYTSLEQQKSLQQQAEAARQPTAHLPPFPGQPTVPPQQRPPSTGPPNGPTGGPPRGGYGASGSIGFQPPQRGAGGGGRGYSGPSPPQAQY